MNRERLVHITLLLALLAVSSSAAEAQGPWILDGRVIDAETMAPIRGAFVASVNSERGTVTDSLGMFALRIDAGPGQAIWISQLGFRDIQAPLDPTHAGQVLTIVLAPDPIQMEGLTVLTQRLANRRRGIYGLGDVLDRQQLLDAPDASGYDLVLRMLPFVEPCSMGGAALCVVGRRSLGQKTRVSVCIDGSTVPAELLEVALSGVDPRSFYLVEVYPRVGAVRMYSPDYMKRLIESGRSLPPLAFGRMGMG